MNTLLVSLLVAALLVSVSFLSFRRGHFRRCRPRAELVRYPRQVLRLYARDLDAAGLVALAGRSIEAISPSLYIAHMDFNLHGADATQFYTLDAEVVGKLEYLSQLEIAVNAGRLYYTEDAELKRAIREAQTTLSIPRAARFGLAIDVLTVDEPLVVKTIAETALKHGGTAHQFHCETINSGRFPGTPDFFINALYGFPTYDSAERAAAALLALKGKYDAVNVKRLYEARDQRKIAALKITPPKRAA